MKIYEVEERYNSAFSDHDAKYLLTAENESQALEAAERKVGAKKSHLLNDGLTVVEIFDPERLERLEERISQLEKKETK